MPDPRSAEFWALEDDLLAEELLPLVEDALLAGAAGGFDLLIPELAVMADFDVLNDAILQHLQGFRIEVLEPLNETTRQAIRQTIEDWIISGEHFDKFKKAFVETLEDVVLTATRAEMIAITEVTNLFAEGNMIAWKSTGLVSGKRWMTAQDDLVCDICRPLDGKVVEIDTDFGLGVDEMTPAMLERALAGEDFTWQRPAAHPRCRCWLQPFVREADIEARVLEVLV